MSQAQKTLACIAALALILVAFGAVIRACERNVTEVMPVLEATTPESTGPAESEEETVERELPPSGGIKLAKLGGRIVELGQA